MTEVQRSSRTRDILLEFLPFLITVLSVLAKVSYFNFPPRTYIENDWYPWYQEEAVKAALSSLATLLIFFSPLLLVSASRRFVALMFLNLALSVLVLGDVLHFRFYGDISSASAASGAWQLTLVWRSIAALLEPVHVLFFADVVIMAGVFPFYRRWAHASAAELTKPRRIAAITFFTAGCLLALRPIGIVRADADGVFRYKYFRFFGVRKIGLLNYHIYEGEERIAQAMFARNRISDEERARALSLVNAWRPEATARSPLFGIARGKNLIMIMVESFQAFPIGLTVDGQEVMPNMTAFARRSLFFDRFYGQTAEGTTSDGEFTSLQSLYPLPAGSVQSSYPGNNYRGIARILAERGYATMSAHGYFGDLWNMRLVHPKLGFQRSFFREDYVQRETLGLGLADVEFFRQTIPRLEGERRPFMAFLITLSTHHDWALPDKYKTLKVGDLESTLVGNYLQSMNHFDAAFGELLDSLNRDGLLKESVVVLYGDHKGNFGKSEAEGRASLGKLLTRYAGWAPPDTAFDHRYWLVQNQLPLIIHLPHDEAAGVRSVTGGHLDIAPTVLGLLGIENHNMTTLGRDLTRGDHEFVVFRNGSFVYADTLCVTPNASPKNAKCRDTRTGATLDASQFSSRFELARQRLAASDAIIMGNLIPSR